MEALFETQDGSGVFYLDEQHYDKDFGVSIDGSGFMEPCIVSNT